MRRSKWDQRIRRADQLSAAHPFAAEILGFYKRLVALQKALYLYVEEARGKVHRSSGSSPLYRRDLRLGLLIPKFRNFLSRMAAIAPEPIGQSAKDLKYLPLGQCRDLLRYSWEDASEFQPALGKADALLAWLFLQPYAENLADHNEPTTPPGVLARCPFCSGKPQVGAVRQEGGGARRFLICSVCSTEWAYGQISCPACGEEVEDKLAIYAAGQFNHVRVEACNTCLRYIKTVDLTKNGLAVPVVDELASIPLNHWAFEHGYTKLCTNLLGI
jgi:FdhE protein